MANIANLEIPGALAYVYDQLDDWQPVHDGKNVITAVGDVQPMEMNYRLPVDINSHPFTKFTTVYFKDSQTWGVRRDPLLTPLTMVNSDQLSQQALVIFKLVLRYMSEKNMSEKKEKVLADYIVQMGLRDEGLRDEVLCQVVNQTWQNPDPEHTDRLWTLMASCLSAFMPNTHLFKYLLKYVSDVAVNAYKWVCQHKILQSANLPSHLSRAYPPCFLEWRCIQRKANMALEVRFSDGINNTGHVESWTSGELLGSYLLKQRGIQDNLQGWTVLLQEDVEFYELMGYDYVLDLLSEMDLAPGFPHTQAPFLVSLDRTQERPHHKRHLREPHNAEQARILKLVGQLPEMMKRTKPVVDKEEGESRIHVEGPFTSTLKDRRSQGFSTTSILNQRPTDIVDVVLSNSPMNQRYNSKRSALNGYLAYSEASSIAEDYSADIDLAQTRLNGRYFPGNLLNTDMADLSTTSRLNTRYTNKMGSSRDGTINSRESTTKDTASVGGVHASSNNLNARDSNTNSVYTKKTQNNVGGAGKSPVKDQIRKKQSTSSVAADAVSVSSVQSDWSHWVEDVFQSALDEHDDDDGGLSEASNNPLHARIKGGGQGLSGLPSQQGAQMQTDDLAYRTLPQLLSNPTPTSVPVYQLQSPNPLTQPPVEAYRILNHIANSVPSHQGSSQVQAAPPASEPSTLSYLPEPNLNAGPQSLAPNPPSDYVTMPNVYANQQQQLYPNQRLNQPTNVHPQPNINPRQNVNQPGNLNLHQAPTLSMDQTPYLNLNQGPSPYPNQTPTLNLNQPGNLNVNPLPNLNMNPQVPAPSVNLNPVQVPPPLPPPPPPLLTLNEPSLASFGMNPLTNLTLPQFPAPTPTPLLNPIPQYLPPVPPSLNIGGLGLTTPTLSVVPPLASPAFAFNPTLTQTFAPQPDPVQQYITQQALQQQAAQQAAQQAVQQAAQQAALQSLLLQNQQRQQQQALLQTLSQQQQQQEQLQQLQLQQHQQQQLQLHQQQQQQQLQPQRLQQEQQQQHPLVVQVAATQIALQQSELENQLLKQSIEREALRKELLQLQQPSIPHPHPTVSIPSAGDAVPSSGAQPGDSPEASYYSLAGLAMPPEVLAMHHHYEQASSSTSQDVTDGSSSGAAAPKRVTFLQEAHPEARDDYEEAMSTSTTTTTTERNRNLSFPPPVQADDVTSVSHAKSRNHPCSPPPYPAPSPPPPPPPHQVKPSSQPSAEEEEEDQSYIEIFNVPLNTEQAILMPPPPPPLHPPPPPPAPPLPPTSTTVSGLEIDQEQGTFTIRDKHGVARTVRVGRVVWPPPIEEAQKKEVSVGKLEINENLAKGIEDQMGGKKKGQKPSSPEVQTQPEEILKQDNEPSNKPKQRSKLTENSEHSAAMLLLEAKLGKSKKNKNQGSPPASSRPLPPIPASESISVQTTDTLKRMKFGPMLGDEEDGVYASTIIRGEPPTSTSSQPKKAQSKTKKLEESFEEAILADLPPLLEKHQQRYQKRAEPDGVVVPSKAGGALMDLAALERLVTELFPQSTRHFLMYNRVPWVLHVRKEVFWPSEGVENLTVRHLLYCQVVQDVHNNACVRLTKDQRGRMKSMLEGYGVTKNNYLSSELNSQVKKIIIDTAKEWPLYFCRLFPVASDSGQYKQVRYLGVSHSGLRLVTREKSLVEDYLSVLENVRFEDVMDIMLPNTTTVQLNLRTKSLLFYAPRAVQLKDMVDRFCQESEKGNKYVVAVKGYVTRESTLLSFKEGDVIKLVDPDVIVQKDWLYGSLNGIVGLFPEQCVRPLALHEVDTSNYLPKLNLPPQTPETSQNVIRVVEGATDDISDSVSSQGTAVTDGQLSMLEFALLHFRQSLDKYEMLRTEDGSIRGTVKKMDTLRLHNIQAATHTPWRGEGVEWTRKEQVNMVQWTRSPIQASLLNLPSSDMNKMALECFVAIMQFMEDYPMGKNQTDYDCVITILKSCHKYKELRDEVFCQLCKQNTNNRSMKGKSKVKGWRLFAVIAAYCDCSQLLRPYLFKFLETTATDLGRTYNHAAAMCLQNLRKTFKYGGRKNVPPRDEVQALADGRNCRRVPFIYSGSSEQGGLLQVKPCTVVQDCIVDACAELTITDPVEMEEYAFYVRTGDGSFTKLLREEYVLDVTTEFLRKKASVSFVFQRTGWMYPLTHMDNDLFVDMMFHQCIFDYVEGLLITWPDGEPTAQTMDEIVLMAALLHKANNFAGVPTLKQLEVLVPHTVRQGQKAPGVQQWVNRVQGRLTEVATHTVLSAKALFLEMLSQWPLFGSTFFLIKSIPNAAGECLLTVSKMGISFLHKDTHETLASHPFHEVLSTRRYTNDAGGSFLDMKIGDLMVQKILRIETDQGSEISNLISQYMQIINEQHKLRERT